MAISSGWIVHLSEEKYTRLGHETNRSEQITYSNTNLIYSPEHVTYSPEHIINPFEKKNHHHPLEQMYEYVHKSQNINK